MATYVMFQPAHQSQSIWSALVDQVSSFCSILVEGLGMFGLAASGMCPSIQAPFAQPTSGEVQTATDADNRDRRELLLKK